MLSKIWAAKDLSKVPKIEVFEVLVVSSLLYDSETWVIKATSRKRLKVFKVFEMACLRKIEGVSRRDRIKNTEIEKPIELPKRHKQTNSAEKVKVLWSYCQNEHTKIPIRGTVWACVRKNEVGQTKEKMDRHGQRRL